jgi:hypothetical protein
MQFWFVETDPGLLNRPQRLGQWGKPFLGLRSSAISIGQ